MPNVCHPQLYYPEAANLVGEAKFGEDYIKELTLSEAWLLYNFNIIRYPSHRERLGWEDDQPDDVSMSAMAAVERYPESRSVLFKWKFMLWQREQIEDWFWHRDIETGDRGMFDEIDETSFNVAFARYFPTFKRKPASEAAASFDDMRIELEDRERRPGRPRKWDWDGALIEMIRLANTPDGLPSVQAKVERHLADWFTTTVGDHPAESKIREKVAAVMRKLEQARNQGS